MNSSNRSLEDGPSVVTKTFPCIFLVALGHFCRFNSGRCLDSIGDCEDRSKRSTCKGLFCNLQLVSLHMEGWSK